MMESTAASTGRVFEDSGELLSTTQQTGVDAEPSLNRGPPEKPRYFQNTDGGYLM
jgi:hypothetical protein